MGLLDFLSKWFGSNKETTKQQEQKKTENKEDMKKQTKTNDDKSFHPEILFLINRPYAEYVDFVEVK